MLTELHRSDLEHDAYLDGLTTGIRLAEAWQADQPPSICLCGPCVRLWALRGLVLILGMALSFILWCVVIPAATGHASAPFAGLTSSQMTTVAAGLTEATTSSYQADQATCHDFMTWHATRRGYMAMVNQSRHADTYLRVDVRGLAHAEHIHQNIATWTGYVLTDCTTTGD